MKLKKGDLLVPKDPSNFWGRGIITEPERLLYPTSHLVYWFSHKRQLIIEEDQVLSDFDVTQNEEAREAD